MSLTIRTKLNNFISGVRILTSINKFLRKRGGGGVQTIRGTALNQPCTVYQVDFQDYYGEQVANLSDAWALANAKGQKRKKCQYDREYWTQVESG